MENQNLQNDDEMWRSMEKSHRRGRLIGGLFIVAAGLLFLGREMGAQLPYWLFSWKTFLIALGLYIGVKHNFRHRGWIVLVLIGSAFIVSDLYPELSIKAYLWPVVLIIVGLFMIFRPSKRRYRDWQNCRARYQRRGDFKAYNGPAGTDEDFVDSTSVFGGVKKNIISKKFRGGDVTNVFGGTELNLMQADFENQASLELTQVFGGTKLIVPANWEIKSTLVNVLGGIEDNRPVQPNLAGGQTKQLLLSGTTFCGGIEITSY
jgi:predicted membrane protein